MKAQKLVLPYGQVDLVMNHKNVWANLQNQNPASIYYHLHDERQWLPLIADPALPHAHLLAAAKPSENKEEEKKKPKKQDPKIQLLDCRMRGDYTKPFMSFYDPKGLEPPHGAMQVAKIESNILKEVEIAIKQVRSSKSLSSKIKRSPAAAELLRRQLDYLEDRECDRLPHSEEERLQIRQHVEHELLKLVPENYRIAILPAFFNYADPERIRTVLNDQAQDFLLNRASSAS